VLAVLATLAANVASGLPDGWPGAVLAGWPAVAFVVSAETVISMSRRRPASSQRTTATGTKRPQPAAKHGHAMRPPATGTEAAVLATLANDRDITSKDLAAAIGVSARTARRYRSRLATPDTSI
jgi:hypothetical protein